MVSDGSFVECEVAASDRSHTSQRGSQSRSPHRQPSHRLERSGARDRSPAPPSWRDRASFEASDERVSFDPAAPVASLMSAKEGPSETKGRGKGLKGEQGKAWKRGGQSPGGKGRVTNFKRAQRNLGRLQAGKFAPWFKGKPKGKNGKGKGK